MSKCDYCDKEIKFIRDTKSGTSIPVNPVAVYFVPDGFGRPEEFITAEGRKVKGCRSRDGMTGYIPHYCREGSLCVR